MNDQTCFVIMPYGKKALPGKPPVDFDAVYTDIIEPAIHKANLDSVRCDNLKNPGSIHERMIEHIHASVAAVADITTFNANVLYELGVRHALKRSVTVIIAMKGTVIPFNLKGLKVINYDLGDKARAIDSIADHIRNGLDDIKSDSLVYDTLKLPVTTGPNHPPLEHGARSFSVLQSKGGAPSGRTLQIITGELKYVQGIDVWANSENNNLEMARMWDSSLSSTIRYLGAVKKNGKIEKDVIDDALSRKAGKWYEGVAGEVVTTTPGELKQFGVKILFHVIAVKGDTPGGGFKAIANIEDCVLNSLSTMERYSKTQLRSILFPLFGTGTGRSDVEKSAMRLISTATGYLMKKSTKVEEISFIARTQIELDACLRAVRKQKKEGILQ